MGTPRNLSDTAGGASAREKQNTFKKNLLNTLFQKIGGAPTAPKKFVISNFPSSSSSAEESVDNPIKKQSELSIDTTGRERRYRPTIVLNEVQKKLLIE